LFQYLLVDNYLLKQQNKILQMNFVPIKIQLGYFQVIEEPVSTCVHEIFEFFPIQSPRFVTKL
jgi:hypothetical protein